MSDALDWQDISTAPSGKPVWTKIDDDLGPRNEQLLTRDGNLWWTGPAAGQGIYVYYQPTHWRPTTPTTKDTGHG
jgi:hypothetical protein